MKRVRGFRVPRPNPAQVARGVVLVGLLLRNADVFVAVVNDLTTEYKEMVAALEAPTPPKEETPE